jgi:hypothetical protein
MTYRKKIIEVTLPLEAINAASAREKSIRHGHPSTLHLWWARRPLAACRAVLFSQLVDDPSSWSERFPTEEAQGAERKRLHDFIALLVKWESSNDQAKAGALVHRSLARLVPRRGAAGRGPDRGGPPLPAGARVNDLRPVLRRRLDPARGAAPASAPAALTSTRWR